MPGFCRLVLDEAEGDVLVIDLAEDAPPLIQPASTFLGPTLDIEESAGQKTLALYGRAEPRDFVDVYALAGRYGRDGLLRLAAERDRGFVPSVLAEMIDQLPQIRDDELDAPTATIPALRAFFADWADALRG